MLEINNHSVSKERTEWALHDFIEKTNSQTSNKILRKFINSAIYIEKPLSTTTSSQNSSVSQKSSSEDFLETKTKRCTCSLDQKTCPCHFKYFVTSASADVESVDSSAGSSETSYKRIKSAQPFGSSYNESCKKSKVTETCTTKGREENKKQEMDSKKEVEMKKNAKEVLIEQERHNFTQWLMNKKKIETEAKKKKEKEIEKQQLQELEKEKRQLENQLNFQLWVKKKEEAQLEKKIKKQVEFINKLQRKEKQIKDNKKAFNDWLENSKSKQKPVPLNKGLQSLRSATSVTYVNPTPWNPVA